MIKILYYFNRNVERLSSSKTLHLGDSFFLFEEHVYEIHHELLLMAFIYIFPHKNGTSGYFTGGD